VSVIAWDGQYLAVDRRCNTGDTTSTVIKSERLEDTGEVMAFVGLIAEGLALMDWYKRGADPDKYPELQNDAENNAVLVVASKDGVREYGFGAPFPVVQIDPYLAWGSGKDVALGALAMGATAEQAVNIASRLVTTCGNGVDVYKVR